MWVRLALVVGLAGRGAGSAWVAVLWGGVTIAGEAGLIDGIGVQLVGARLVAW